MNLVDTNFDPFFAKLSSDDAHTIVRDAKVKLGEDLLILGHHYQRDEVIVHADVTGDSLKLAKVAQSASAQYIIFCGVHFMAETADILTSGQKFICLPDLKAGCDMADMAHIRDIEDCWHDLLEEGFNGTVDRVIPVTYINSSAALKAFVGRHGGAICTSSNAHAILTWALANGKHVFFFPDQHLGRNVAKKMMLDPTTDMILWNPKKHLGGQTKKRLQETKIWLWQGHCPVHALFTVHQVKHIRLQAPDTTIIVHPECAMEIVDVADLSGSTDFIINTIDQAPSGSKWAVGTEKHLVERLAAKYPDKDIKSLNPYTCLCSTMNKISIQNLAWALSNLIHHGIQSNQIRVERSIALDAELALSRMMDLS